jgi:hypothetical protein
MTSQITWTILDEKGLRSNTVIDVPDGHTVAEYTAFANDATTQLLQVSDGQILAAKLSLNLVLAGAPFAAAAADSDVERKALFVFNTAGGYIKRLTVPSVRGIVVTESGALDLTGDPGAGGFRDLIIDGDLTVEPTDYRGDDIVSLSEARKYFGSDRGG